MSTPVALWRCQSCGALQWLRYYAGQWHCPTCQPLPTVVPTVDYPPSDPDE